MINSSDNPLTIQSIDIVQQMRQVLLSKGFASPKAVEGIKILGGGRHLSDITRIPNNSMPSLVDTDIPEALETLLRLFIFGATIERDLVVRAISPMKLDDWFEMGLLASADNGVRAELQLMIYKNFAFALDFNSENKAKDHVIGVTAASQTLEFLTIRRNVHSILDIGTGTGIQAMIAASHGEKVIATDINARAVNVAAFNAWLNGLDISCRVGDLFEPVDGETFDLIISCPPFVLSPDDRFHYLDSGHFGDKFLEKLVTEGVQLLNKGGYLQVMCQVGQHGDELWSERIASWLKGADCDAWVLFRETMSPEDHARMWIPKNSPSPDKVLQEWVEYYEKNNIISITSCLFTIRKSDSDDNWFCIDEIPQGNGYCGESIENGFRARDVLNSVKDENDLLNLRLVFSSDVEIKGSAGSVGDDKERTVIQLSKGLMFSEIVDDMTLAFLQCCDGKLVVDSAIKQAQQSTGRIVDKVEYMKDVRNLLFKGFLLPVS